MLGYHVEILLERNCWINDTGELWSRKVEEWLVEGLSGRVVWWQGRVLPVAGASVVGDTSGAGASVVGDTSGAGSGGRGGCCRRYVVVERTTHFFLLSILVVTSLSSQGNLDKGEARVCVNVCIEHLQRTEDWGAIPFSTEGGRRCGGGGAGTEVRRRRCGSVFLRSGDVLRPDG